MLLFFVMLVLGFLMILIGLGWINRSLKIIRVSKESLTWTTANATITKSRVNKLFGLQSKGYLPEIVYEFNIGGKKIVSDTIYFGLPNRGTQKQVTNIVSQFPVGATVPVHYQPSEPNKCVLIPGAKVHHYLILVTSVMLTLMGCGVVALGFYSIK